MLKTAGKYLSLSKNTASYTMTVKSIFRGNATRSVFPIIIGGIRPAGRPQMINSNYLGNSASYQDQILPKNRLGSNSKTATKIWGIRPPD